MKNPVDVAAKWARNLGNAQDAIKAGVNALTVAPSTSAIARKDAWVQGVQRAASDGKWERGLAKIDINSWKNAMLNKGLGRIASGAAQAQPKMQSFMQQWLPYMDQLQQKLATMPRGDLNTNIQRAVTAIQFASQFQRQ